MNPRNAVSAFAVLACGAVLHFSHLTWGAPSWDKHFSVFSSREEIDRWTGPILELREKYWENHAQMLDPNRSEQESRAIYQKTFRLEDQLGPWSVLPREFILDRVRGTLIGVALSDEQHTLKALGNMNPLRGRFDPQVYFYGGFYYDAAGVMLAAGKVLGLVSLSRDPAYYFTHPEETARMYALIRSLGGIALLLTAGLILWKFREELGPGSALAAALLVLTPLAVPLSHQAKAHLFGLFFFSSGFWLCWKGAGERGMKPFLIGSALLGLCAGSLITNLAVGIAIVLLEGQSFGWSLRSWGGSRKMWLGLLAFAAVYAATNFYLITDFAALKKTVWAAQEYTRGYDEYGTVNFGQWLPFLQETFTRQMHWSVLPLLAAGLWAAFLPGRGFLKACALSFLALTAVNLLTTRHPGVNARTLALAASLAAGGAAFLLKNRTPAVRRGLLLYVGIAVALSGMSAAFNLSLLRRPGNLARAGAWINDRLPDTTSIGAVGAQISQSSFPPIRFLNYRIVHVPKDASAAPPSDDQLPEYVATVDPDHPILQTRYHLLKTWPAPTGWLGLRFPALWPGDGNLSVYLFQREAGA